jgi:large subunit ribosomal protein L18
MREKWLRYRIRKLRTKKKLKRANANNKYRLSVYRSLKHIYAQIIDDSIGHTLVSASTLDKEIRENVKHTGNKEAASKVGELLARRALEKGITEVIFDRGGRKFHGRIKSLADAARQAGLKF